MNIAVLLSGCGVFDGSEIYETTLTLLALTEAQVDFQCLAPNRLQHHVIDHQHQTEQHETRNILTESARLARGEIMALDKAKPDDYDAVIVPGGFGVAKNLCDFALAGEHYQLQEGTQQFLSAIISAGKPAGFMCIAPVMVPLLYPKGVKTTIGNDQGIAQTLEAKGAQHITCSVDNIVIDEANKVVSTPAYMLAKNIVEAKQGIDKLVKAVIRLA